MSTYDPIIYDRSRAFAKVVGAKGGQPLKLLITADETRASTKSGQTILSALCEILPRISERYTSIDLCLPRVPYLLHGEGSAIHLDKILVTRLRDVCPWGTFTCVPTPLSNYDVSVHIGPFNSTNSQYTLYVHATGWRCFISRNQDGIDWRTGTFNPFSCLATAAIASSTVYAAMENISTRRSTGDILGWSLFDFTISSEDGPALPPELDLGTIVQGGLGASANALFWGLRLGPSLRGNWLAYEHEILDLPNANRYLLITPADVGLAKCAVVKREFTRWQKHLDFLPLEGRIEEKCRGDSVDSIVLATVDDEAIRVYLQNLNPKLLLNVGTQSQFLSLSRHPWNDISAHKAPCIQCLYPDPSVVGRRQREATVSFVSAMVGALLGSELVKTRVFPDAVLSYEWLGNIFQVPDVAPFKPARRKDCPICSNSTRVMEELWENQLMPVR